SEPLRGSRIAQLGALPEREQRLVTACGHSGAGDRQDVLGAQVRTGQARRRLCKGAVAAAVLTKHRERYEDLRRVRDSRPITPGAKLTSAFEQVLEGHG